MAGIFYRHKQPKPPCEGGSANITLGLLHLQGVFYLLAAGMCLAIIVLLLERSTMMFSCLHLPHSR
jgi:hypothetical protein